MTDLLSHKWHMAQSTSYYILWARHILNIKVVASQLGHPVLRTAVQLWLCHDVSQWISQVQSTALSFLFCVRGCDVVFLPLLHFWPDNRKKRGFAIAE